MHDQMQWNGMDGMDRSGLECAGLDWKWICNRKEMEVNMVNQMKHGMAWHEMEMETLGE